MKKKPVAKADDSEASDAVDEPEEVSDDEPASKRRTSGRNRPAAKKAKVDPPSSSEGEEEAEDEEDAEDDEEEGDDDDESENSEEEYKTDQSGSYVVLKTDLANGGDPPIWKIDGKALLQKYVPFQEEGKTLYRNTSTYSGWSTGNKDNYYSAPIVYKIQNRKETVVEFLRDSIKIETPAATPAADEKKVVDKEQ